MSSTILYSVNLILKQKITDFAADKYPDGPAVYGPSGQYSTCLTLDTIQLTLEIV